METNKMETIDLLSLTDTELGIQCRKLAKYLSEKKIEGYEQLSSMSAIFLLCSHMKAANIGNLVLDLDDVTSEKYPDPVSFKIVIDKVTNIKN